MDTMKKLFRFAVASFLLVLLLPGAALAQGGQEGTTLRVGAPTRIDLGESVTVQAVLLDSAGKPISNARIYFTVPASFLTASGDIVVTQGVTNERGQAVAEFVNQLQGPLSLRAEFRGSDRYARSDASTEIDVSGSAQLYAPQVGVQIPGLNQPPSVPVAASLSRPLLGTGDFPDLWPSMSGWPIAAVLITIWSLYLFAIGLIFRVAASGRASRGDYNPETGRFE